MGAISATTETDVDLIAARNIRPTLDLLEWCTRAQVPLIYASSAATYGDGAAGFDDTFSIEALAKLRPLNAYGWSKHVVDRRIARLAALGRPLPPQWVGLKFFNVYGPNEYHKGAMQSVVAKNYGLVRGGEPLRLFRSHRPDYADGGQLRDFIYVRDCVDVMLWLLEHPQVSGLFNWAPEGPAAGWTSRMPCSRPSARARSSSSTCRRRSRPSISTSPRRICTACAPRATSRLYLARGRHRRLCAPVSCGRRPVS